MNNRVAFTQHEKSTMVIWHGKFNQIIKPVSYILMHTICTRSLNILLKMYIIISHILFIAKDFIFLFTSQSPFNIYVKGFIYINSKSNLSGPQVCIVQDKFPKLFHFYWLLIQQNYYTHFSSWLGNLWYLEINHKSRNHGKYQILQPKAKHI